MTVESGTNPHVSNNRDVSAIAPDAPPKAVWVTPTVEKLDVGESRVAGDTATDADALS